MVENRRSFFLERKSSTKKEVKAQRNNLLFHCQEFEFHSLAFVKKKEKIGRHLKLFHSISFSPKKKNKNKKN